VGVSKKAPPLEIKQRPLHQGPIIRKRADKVRIAGERHYGNPVAGPKLPHRFAPDLSNLADRNPHTSADIEEQHKIQRLLFGTKCNYLLLGSVVEHPEIRLSETRRQVPASVVHLHVHVNQRHAARELRRIVGPKARRQRHQRSQAGHEPDCVNYRHTRSRL